jgi:hypothetical protein
MSFTPTDVRNMLLCGDYTPSPFAPEGSLAEFAQNYAMMEVLSLHANEPNYLDEFVVTFTRGSHVAFLDARPHAAYIDYYSVGLGQGIGKHFCLEEHDDLVNILLYIDPEQDISVVLQRRRLLSFLHDKAGWSGEMVVRAIGTAGAIMDASDYIEEAAVHENRPLPDIGFVYDYEMTLHEFARYLLIVPEYKCGGCEGERVGMGKCSLCGYAFYCCDECQIKHSHAHKHVCKRPVLTSSVNDSEGFMLGLGDVAMSNTVCRSERLRGMVNYVMQTDECDPYANLAEYLTTAMTEA